MYTIPTTKKDISLDFYNNSIVNIYAKKSDANSRTIEITCTDNGKKVKIDNNIASAFVRMKKSDGTYIYNNAIISNEGIIKIELAGQMLSVAGKHVVDIMILSNPNITSTELEALESTDDLNNTSVISVMPFYLIVTDSAVDNSEIASTNEFDALVQATSKLKILESRVRASESDRNEAETIRDDNENARMTNETERRKYETTRQSNESTRQSNESARETQIETWGKNVDAAINNCNTSIAETIKNCNTAIDTAIDNCEKATASANKAVEDFEAIKDQSGIVMQDEKGVANGIATLNVSGKVPSEQLNIANNLTTTTTGSLLDASQGNVIKLELEDLKTYVDESDENINKKITDNYNSLKAYIDAKPTIHFNDTIDDSIGKDGDILMIPIQ